MKFSDTSDYNICFLMGLYNLWQNKYSQARKHFLESLNKTDKIESHYSLYQSYLGLSYILEKKKSGLIHCYDAVHNSPEQVEVKLNLVVSEFLLGHRKRAVDALDTLNDLKPSEQDKELINALLEIVGKRKSKRRIILSPYISKIFRKKVSFSEQHLESFFRNSVKSRYLKTIELWYRANKDKSCSIKAEKVVLTNK